MKTKFDQLVIWFWNLVERVKEWFNPPPLFKLSKETLEDVMIYGGIDWSAQDEYEREQLSQLPTQEDREKKWAEVISMREWIETERNREVLSYYLPLMKPEQIRQIERKIQRGERLEVKKLNLDSIRGEEQYYELPY